jgi:hypothetical protein
MPVIRCPDGKLRDYAEYEDIIKPMWREQMRKEGGEKVNKKMIKETVEEIIKERDILKDQLIAIAHKIDSTKPWKVVLRTELGVVI